MIMVMFAGCGGGDISTGPDNTGENLGGPTPSPNCTLIVPDGALTAQGLATPYRIRTSDWTLGSCRELVDNAAFVQATILDPATGNITVYNPLVIGAFQDPAVPPVVPKLPDNAVVGIWFGFNGDQLKLRGASSSTLSDANCVNGVEGSIFGQVAFCNARQFFAAARQVGYANLHPAPPALGTAVDGQPCPTVRSFFTVDQDQSDNVTSTYLTTTSGLAQNTAANRARFPDATVLANGSDNKLLAIALDSAFGCTPYKAPDLADPGAMVTAQALNEIMASLRQAPPVALVPSGDPMVLVNGAPSVFKQNRYRAGVGQPLVGSGTLALSTTTTNDTAAYCKNLVAVQPPRLKANQTLFSGRASPDPAAATNLFTFMGQRFVASLQELNCANFGVTSPISCTFDMAGVATSCSISVR
jgi:hypothetical protein